MNLSQNWCLNHGGTYYHDPKLLHPDGCIFFPGIPEDTINNYNYLKTDINHNLKGWLPSRITSNWEIGKTILTGEEIVDYDKFNQVQTQFCHIPPSNISCNQNQECQQKLDINSYCYKSKCFPTDFPVSIVSEKQTYQKKYGNIIIPTLIGQNLTDEIFKWTDTNFKNGSPTDAFQLKCL